MAHHYNREELLEKIQEVNLICVDLNLYLDTHPDCEVARQDYVHFNKCYLNLVDEYQKNYGPLFNFGLMSEPNMESYTAGPWPWQHQSKGENVNVGL